MGEFADAWWPREHIPTFVGNRQSGKSTRLIRWLEKEPEGETRFIICVSPEAKSHRQRHSPPELRGRFVTREQTKYMRGHNNPVYAIDDLDCYLDRLFPGLTIGAIAMTGDPWEDRHG